MAKKLPAPITKRMIPTLSFEEVGSGITKRQVPKITGLSPPEEIIIRRSVKIPQSSLSDTLEFAVKLANRCLVRHGIEFQPDGIYRTEDGRTHTLVGLVEAMGHRAYEFPLWYSACIIQSWFDMLERIAEGDAESAANLGFEIGRLHAEAKIKGRWEEIALAGKRSRDGATKGGKQDKRLPPVGELVRVLLRKNRKSTAAELWEMVPTDMLNSIRVRNHKFYRNCGRLLALGKVDGYLDMRPVGKPLKFSAFQKRVTKARTPPSR